jgi:hypothetical protein
MFGRRGFLKRAAAVAAVAPIASIASFGEGGGTAATQKPVPARPAVPPADEYRWWSTNTPYINMSTSSVTLSSSWRPGVITYQPSPWAGSIKVLGGEIKAPDGLTIRAGESAHFVRVDDEWKMI